MKKSKRQKLRWFTPFIAVIGVIIFTDLGLNILACIDACPKKGTIEIK